jgi:hypothetical protein
MIPDNPSAAAPDPKVCGACDHLVIVRRGEWGVCPIRPEFKSCGVHAEACEKWEEKP